VELRVTLLEVLRERLGLTGTERIPEDGEFDSCTVTINHRAAKIVENNRLDDTTALKAADAGALLLR